MATITCCDTCPFIVPADEYDGYCNHPSAPNELIDDTPGQQWKGRECDLEMIGYEKSKNLINPDTGKPYQQETSAIPLWCPLRNVPFINIPQRVDIKLLETLFIENIKK